MKDKELKVEDVKDPHTLGWGSYILFEYIDPTEVGEDIRLYEFVYYESIKRDLNKRLEFDQSDGGRVEETEESFILSLLKESICICERGEWGRVPCLFIMNR